MFAYGILYLALLAAFLCIGGSVSAIVAWCLYSLQGGRLGLFAWLRRMW